MRHGAPDHRKMKEFADELYAHISGQSMGGAALRQKLCLTLANGTMERLWRYATEYLISGDVSPLGPARFADELGFEPQDAEWLITTLIRVRFLVRLPSGALAIHDWREHCEDSVHRRLWSARARFADGSAPNLRPLRSDERAEAKAFYERPTPPKPRSRGQKLGKPASERPPPSCGPSGDDPHSKCGALPSPAQPSQALPRPRTVPTAEDRLVAHGVQRGTIARFRGSGGWAGLTAADVDRLHAAVIADRRVADASATLAYRLGEQLGVEVRKRRNGSLSAQDLALRKLRVARGVTP